MTTTDNILKSLGKQFTDIVFETLDELKDANIIPFGIPSLDDVTGVGGVPRGRVTELYGSESSGKSALCLALVSEAQKQGLPCAYVDMELSMTRELASKIGVDLTQLIYAQPLTGENAFTLIDKLIEAGVKLIIVDSVSSLVPEGELEKEYTEETIGLQARLMSKAMRKILGTVKQNDVALVFVNQVRDEINKFGFGDKKTTSGGRALKFYSSLRLEVSRIAWVTKSEQKVGLQIKVLVRKNKMKTPMREAQFEFLFDTGFDKGGDALRFLEAKGIIKRVGRAFFHGDTEIGQKEDAVAYITKHNLLHGNTAETGNR